MAPPIPAAMAPIPPRASYMAVEASQTSALQNEKLATPPPDDGVEKVAVILTHGMGQQVPFETLEMLANAVRKEAAIQGTYAPPVVIRVVRLGTAGELTEPQLARAELSLTLPQRKLYVHFYEVYWAPLTEGKVTILDVIAFLLSAGWLGIKNSFAGKFFERWMFGAFQRFPKKTWTLSLSFLMAILEVLSLVFVNGIIAAVATSKLLTAGNTKWPTPALRSALTFDMLFIVAALGIVGMGVFVVPRGFRYLAWAFVWTGIVALPVASSLMGLHILGRQIALPPANPAWIQTVLKSKWTLLTLWGLAFIASAKVRNVLVEYVGDVAAYVNAHTVSKFWTIRKEIYETAMHVFGPVYKARHSDESGQTPAPTFQYGKIFVVGHSLGSVISYDSLNGLLLEDELSAPPLNVPERTKLLLTFGSPLDKTAFIFRTHKKNSEIREAAAAAVQPMIVDYPNRPRQWVNIHSPNDWISGSLEFYDTNPAPPNPMNPNPPLNVKVPVTNIVDPEANSPLIAHIQYWNNAKLREILYTALTS